MLSPAYDHSSYLRGIHRLRGVAPTIAARKSFVRPCWLHHATLLHAANDNTSYLRDIHWLWDVGPTFAVRGPFVRPRWLHHATLLPAPDDNTSHLRHIPLPTSTVAAAAAFVPRVWCWGVH